MQPALADYAEADYSRADVYNDRFEVVEKLGAAICDVTRRRLTLTARDSITGWYGKRFVDCTIPMVIIPRASTRVLIAAGTHARNDAVGLTPDVARRGDEIKDAFGKYWRVKGVTDIPFGDSASHGLCDLAMLPMHGLSYTVKSPSVDDARYLTKDYWDDNIEYGNLECSYIVCYSGADYPLDRVFLDKHIRIVFAIDSPDPATPMKGHDQDAYGYEEHVPTHILTLDTELNHLAETELRRVVEENAVGTGSQRELERRSETVHNFGGLPIYDTKQVLTYNRDLT